MDIQIKPLEWTAEDNGDFIAVSAVGWYHIGLPASYWSVTTPSGEILSGFDTHTEAQAAAQADYERRILSALAHPPAKREAGETELANLIDINAVIALVKDCGEDAQPESEYRLACNDLVEALSEFAPAPVQHMTGEPIGYLKPRQTSVIEPFFIYADERREEWLKQIFTVPVYAAPPQPRERVSDTPSAAVEADENWQVEYEVVMKDGDFCASSTDLNDAMHYAAMYSADGPVEVIEVRRRTLEASHE